jgi:hypothetical protein
MKTKTLALSALRLAISLAEQRSAQTDAAGQDQEVKGAAIMGYSSTAVTMILPVSKRDEHKAQWCDGLHVSCMSSFLGAGQGAPHV